MAGTTSSSGLNNLLSSTNQQQTTLPSWYDTAQQNVINQAGSALGQAPSLGQTTAQGAINTLQGATNPFTQAQTSLNQIAYGAANPFTTNPTTGVTTPNTNTALGGLFSAQQQQLNQLLPQITSGAEAGAIGSGNFGSLRGQTAVDLARGNAFDTLAAQQMQAALQNQQAGATAGGALGNVGAQGITADLTTGAAQMNAPFQAPTNYANLVNAVNAPATVSLQNQQSPLQMVSTLAGLPSAATNLTSALFGSAGKTGTLANALSNIPGLSSLFGSSTPAPVDYTNGVTTNPSGTSVLTPDESGNTQNSLGQTVLPDGTVL
jgi:hypothetical protein